ncbi:hypothetical protein niasHS_004578 [Heterodera schachtii]|uniref:Uncharacterized protein n=1 Tax=Heterodera schachtii TaxID=97005 RepID=A0ABD2JQT3_HETSC
MTNFAGEQQEKENVRIRVIYRKDDGASHASVVVGFYEYDFIRKCARRRKFRCEIDQELDEFDEKKDRPFKGDGLFVEKGKADQVFFEMSGRFWFKENYSYDTANCLDFIFNFVCALFDAKCPPKRIWPDNFVGFDIEMIRSRTYSHGVREPQSVFDRQPIILPDLEMLDHQNCELKDHRLEIRIKNCVLNSEKCANLLFFHLTGRFDGPIEDREQLKNPILVQTKPEKEWKNAKNDGTIHLPVVLKAYSCKTGARKIPKTFVTDLFVFEETATKWLKMKNVCHFHNFNALTLDEITDHIVEAEFDSWVKLK